MDTVGTIGRVTTDSCLGLSRPCVRLGEEDVGGADPWKHEGGRPVRVDGGSGRSILGPNWSA